MLPLRPFPASAGNHCWGGVDQAGGACCCLLLGLGGARLLGQLTLASLLPPMPWELPDCPDPDSIAQALELPPPGGRRGEPGAVEAAADRGRSGDGSRAAPHRPVRWRLATPPTRVDSTFELFLQNGRGKSRGWRLTAQ